VELLSERQQREGQVSQWNGVLYNPTFWLIPTQSSSLWGPCQPSLANSHGRLPVRVVFVSASLPMKLYQVDPSLRKFVLERNVMDESAFKRGERFHKTSPPTFFDCFQYCKTHFKVHASRALQYSRARVPVRVRNQFIWFL
jgi:hypothetical protein